MMPEFYSIVQDSRGLPVVDKQMIDNKHLVEIGVAIGAVIEEVTGEVTDVAEGVSDEMMSKESMVLSESSLLRVQWVINNVFEWLREIWWCILVNKAFILEMQKCLPRNARKTIQSRNLHIKPNL